MKTTLDTPSTRVAGHVAANGRKLAPAFASRYSAERYRRQLMETHVQQAWQQPDATVANYLSAEQARLLRLQARARRAARYTLLGMALLLVVAGVLRYCS